MATPTSNLRTRLSEALDEAEKLANGALIHPTRFDPATLDHVRDESARPDDGVWHVGEYYYEGEVATSSGEIIVYDEGRPNADQALHIARWDPSTVLRLVKRDRELIEEYDRSRSAQFPDFDGGYATALDFELERAAAFWLGTQEAK